MLLKESIILLSGKSVILYNEIAKISNYIYTNIFYKKKKKKNRGAIAPQCPSLPPSMQTATRECCPCSMDVYLFIGDVGFRPEVEFSKYSVFLRLSQAGSAYH